MGCLLRVLQRLSKRAGSLAAADEVDEVRDATLLGAQRRALELDLLGKVRVEPCDFDLHPLEHIPDGLRVVEPIANGREQPPLGQPTRDDELVVASVLGRRQAPVVPASLAAHLPHVAANAIVLATLTNTTVKCGIVAVLGGAALRRPVLIATGAILAAAVGTIPCL